MCLMCESDEVRWAWDVHTFSGVVVLCQCRHCGWEYEISEEEYEDSSV